MGWDNCKICENGHCIEDQCVFDNLDESEIFFLNQRKTIVKYRKKDIVLRKPDRSSILFICEGFAKVFLNGNYNKKFLVEILGTNSFINPPLNCIDSNQTIIAMTDLKVCIIDLNDIISLGEKNGKFATRIWRRFNANSSNYLVRFSSIALKQSRGKLADALIYIDKNYNGINIYDMITRKDIADLANISNENAIRTLREFETEGIISSINKKIEILNYHALLKISKIC